MAKQVGMVDKVKDTVDDIVILIKTTSKGEKQKLTSQSKVRMAVLALMGVTLVFSGISLSTWVVLILLGVIFNYI